MEQQTRGDGESAVLDHPTAWDEQEYLALRATSHTNARLELIDGTLVVGPAATPVHDEALAAVRRAIETALPDGLRVHQSVPVRLGLDCLVTPDLVVARADAEADADAEPEVVAADDTLMVVDIVGLAHGVVTRSFVPQLYARSAIPYAVLVDADAPYGVAAMLIGGRYHEYAEAGSGQRLVLEEPFALTLDLPSFASP